MLSAAGGGPKDEVHRLANGDGQVTSDLRGPTIETQELDIDSRSTHADLTRAERRWRGIASGRRAWASKSEGQRT